MKQRNVTEFIRVEKTKNYTVIHNQFLRRKDLSWKAKGILAYILSLPDDWNINLKEVMTHATDGEGSFRSGWKELEEKGYTKRYPVKDEQTKRIKYWQTVIHEIAQKPHSEKPHVEKPDVEKPHVENSNLLSTKELSTNKLSTDKESSPAEAEQIPYKVVIDYLNEKADRSFKHTASGNQKVIKARWNEGYDENDFKKVIDIKVSHANDPKHWFEDEYLRPATLFSQKFDQYLNETPSWKGKGTKDEPTTDFNDLSSLLGAGG